MKHLTARQLIVGHDECILRYGGLSGVPDSLKVQVLIERVCNYEYYEGVDNVFALAAMYCIAIARGHVFLDGNKRTAINATYVFLKENGIKTRALPDLEETILKVATGEIKVDELTDYFSQAFGN